MAEVKVTSYGIDSEISSAYLTVVMVAKELSHDVKNNTSVVSFSWTATQGLSYWGTTRNSAAELEFSIDSSVVDTKTIPLVKNSSAGKQWYGSGSTTVKHNSDGTKTANLKVKIGKGRGYANGYAQDHDPFVYAEKSGTKTLELTDIDRAGPTFSGLSVNWVTATKASIHFDVNCTLSELQYQLGGKWYILDEGVRDFEISDLTPNYTRKITLWGKRAYNNVASYSNGLDVTTPKPNKPTAGKVEVSNITPFGATVDWSGFSFGEHATWGHYNVLIKPVGTQTDWIDNDRSTTYVGTGLKPNTKYVARVQLVDNYGTASDIVDVEFTTLNDQAKAWVNADGKTQKAKVWACDSKGNIRKVKKIYVNVDGVIKHTKTT